MQCQCDECNRENKNKEIVFADSKQNTTEEWNVLCLWMS